MLCHYDYSFLWNSSDVGLVMTSPYAFMRWEEPACTHHLTQTTRLTRACDIALTMTCNWQWLFVDRIVARSCKESHDLTVTHWYFFHFTVQFFNPMNVQLDFLVYFPAGSSRGDSKRVAVTLLPRVSTPFRLLHLQFITTCSLNRQLFASPSQGTRFKESYPIV